MSALAMILTAAMVVPGDVSEKVSGEVEERLDLSGEWEGSFWLDKETCYSVASVGSVLFGSRGQIHTLIDTKGIIDDGHGRLHGTWLFANNGIQGIYKWENDRLFLCFSRCPDPRPRAFYADNKQCLLILHRVEPPKVSFRLRILQQLCDFCNEWGF